MDDIREWVRNNPELFFLIAGGFLFSLIEFVKSGYNPLMFGLIFFIFLLLTGLNWLFHLYFSGSRE